MSNNIEIPHTHLTMSCIKDYDGIAEWRHKMAIANRPNIKINDVMHVGSTDYYDLTEHEGDPSAMLGAVSVIACLVLGFLFGWFMGRGL